MEAFSKVCRIGDQAGIGSTFIKIKWDGARLSITGVEGPKSNGNCRGSCGQIVMSANEWDFSTYAPGWDAAMVTKLVGVWQAHHRNDMVAGSPNQEAHLKTLPKWSYGAEGFKSHYEWALAKLTEAGLQPDKGFERNGKPYSYGSAWLRRDVPEDVLAWLVALPNADRKPAWV